MKSWLNISELILINRIRVLERRINLIEGGIGQIDFIL